MTLKELETLIEDTRQLSHVADKVGQATALGVLEIARQLSILNSTLVHKDTVKAKKRK